MTLPKLHMLQVLEQLAMDLRRQLLLVMLNQLLQIGGKNGQITNKQFGQILGCLMNVQLHQLIVTLCLTELPTTLFLNKRTRPLHCKNYIQLTKPQQYNLEFIQLLSGLMLINLLSNKRQKLWKLVD